MTRERAEGGGIFKRIMFASLSGFSGGSRFQWLYTVHALLCLNFPRYLGTQQPDAFLASSGKPKREDMQADAKNCAWRLENEQKGFLAAEGERKGESHYKFMILLASLPPPFPPFLCTHGILLRRPKNGQKWLSKAEAEEEDRTVLFRIFEFPFPH